MSDISNQLIKDSYNYILQSDLSTGVVYRIGGGIPVNPIFSSGLTINTNFNFSNGTEENGYVLTSDSFGNAFWGPVSGSSSGEYLSLSGGTVFGPTIFTDGITANTISATTYQNLPKDIFVTGGTYNNGTATFTNNSGGTFGVSGFSTSTGTSFTGGTVSGATNFTGGLTSTTISATTISATTISATTYLGLPTNVSDAYIFSSNNSDIGGYEQMVILPLFVPNDIASIVTTVSTSPTLLANFATNLNYPNTSLIPSGIVTVHFETQKNTGSNTYECFAEIYKRNLAGTETLLGTSDMTSVIATNVVIQQTVSILLPTNVTILTTDRLVVKIYANILSGVNRDITLFYDDSTNSRLQLPVTSVSIAGLVPYSGATTNVNLGNNNLTANNITATTISATTYQNLPPSSVKSINSVSINTDAGNNQNTDYIYFASNSITITLPTAISNTNSYVIKNVGTSTITINTTSSQTIDGSLTALINVQYLSLTLISDGANWNII